jgi:hypothetical protein
VARHRIVYLFLTLAFAALVIAVVALAPSGEDSGLPEPLEGIFPASGDAVVRQTAIEIDLPVGYTIELWVDGNPIPPIEIGLVESTGRFVWQPGPGRIMEQWPGGDHSARVTWDRSTGRPDPGEYEWRFRVQ